MVWPSFDIVKERGEYMYTLKIVSDREALYQFASYVRVVQGVEDVYVEVGRTFIRTSINEILCTY